MRNCIEYLLKEGKTDRDLVYLSGPYSFEEISYDFVYRSFLEEKQIWGKDSGRMYAHNIISWHKDEQITLEQALEFGKEFAENWFSGFQTLVAVHKDREHIHCHFVTNSVSYLDGHKLHNTKKDLEKMKQLTNRMCMERGLTVAEKGRHFDGSEMEPGTIIAWNKDKYHLLANSDKPGYLVSCAVAVVDTLSSSSCTSQQEFIAQMAARGFQVYWKKNRKYITFEDAEGHKIRNRNLAGTFHLKISKEELEHEFARQDAIRRGRADAELEQYCRQIEAAASGDVAGTGKGDEGAGSAQAERKDAGSGRDTEALIRKIESAAVGGRNAIHQSRDERRKSEAADRTVTAAEDQSIAAEEQRQLAKQQRAAAYGRAGGTDKRAKKRSEPEL